MQVALKLEASPSELLVYTFLLHPSTMDLAWWLVCSDGFHQRTSENASWIAFSKIRTQFYSLFSKHFGKFSYIIFIRDQAETLVVVMNRDCTYRRGIQEKIKSIPLKTLTAPEDSFCFDHICHVRLNCTSGAKGEQKCPPNSLGRGGWW